MLKIRLKGLNINSSKAGLFFFGGGGGGFLTIKGGLGLESLFVTSRALKALTMKLGGYMACSKLFPLWSTKWDEDVI